MSVTGSKNLSPNDTRAEAMRSLSEGVLDVLVIGGGIVGAGVARDAAMRGMRTGLLEQHDFAFGTSSRSSRLLHGGIRYLAQGRIGLVREASLEKRILHTIAPHVADPLPFIFPTYRGTDWPLWQMRIGVKFYDLLCSGKNLGKSSGLNKNELLKVVPALKTDKLTGAVRYFDGLTNDARLVIDTLRSATKAGAVVLNYAKFGEAVREGDVWCCTAYEPSGESFNLRARAIVNCTGPWADCMSQSKVKLRLTKGIHIVVPRVRLPVPDAVVITEGKRVLFVIPWGERLIIGTTDTDYTGSPDEVRADQKDIDYVLRQVNSFFPSVNLAMADIISTWAGLRPLVADPNGKPSDISRAHEIHNPEAGWWDITGGKLTTYRLMAEQAVNAILRSPQKPTGPVSACRTADEPLLPPMETAGVSAIVPPEFGRRVVEHACTQEWARHLDDVMIRRTSWHYYHADAAQKAAQAADWMSFILGWSDGEREAELARYHAAAGPSRTSHVVNKNAAATV